MFLQFCFFYDTCLKLNAKVHLNNLPINKTVEIDIEKFFRTNHHFRIDIHTSTYQCHRTHADNVKGVKNLKGSILYTSCCFTCVTKRIMYVINSETQTRDTIHDAFFRHMRNSKNWHYVMLKDFFCYWVNWVPSDTKVHENVNKIALDYCGELLMSFKLFLMYFKKDSTFLYQNLNNLNLHISQYPLQESEKPLKSSHSFSIKSSARFKNQIKKSVQNVKHFDDKKKRKRINNSILSIKHFSASHLSQASSLCRFIWNILLIVHIQKKLNFVFFSWIFMWLTVDARKIDSGDIMLYLLFINMWFNFVLLLNFTNEKYIFLGFIALEIEAILKSIMSFIGNWISILEHHPRLQFRLNCDDCWVKRGSYLSQMLKNFFFGWI